MLKVSSISLFTTHITKVGIALALALPSLFPMKATAQSSVGYFTQYLDPIGSGFVNGSPDNVLVGDFNGDRKQNLYFHFKSSGTNRLYLSNGNGRFTQYLDPIATTAINGSPDNVLVGDFNGDRKQDLYFHFKSSGTNRLYLSNGNGRFTQYLDPIATTAINGSPDNVRVGDFNGDGKQDLYFHFKASGTNRLYLSYGNFNQF